MRTLHISIECPKCEGGIRKNSNSCPLCRGQWIAVRVDRELAVALHYDEAFRAFQKGVRAGLLLSEALKKETRGPSLAIMSP